MKKGQNLTHQQQENIWGWLFILPTMIGLVVLNIIPLIQTIYQSFFRTGDFGRGNVFIGLDNYTRLINDSGVWQALWNNIRYVIAEVPVSIAISLVFAVLLNRKMRGRTVYRTIFFLPMVVAPAAAIAVWRWLYNADFGLLNNFFGLNVNWLTDPNIALYSIAAIGVWGVIGFNVVLFLSGLQEVPKDYYEAAEIDGANGIHQFINITIPMISPTIFFVCVTRIIGSFQLFVPIFMLTPRGNPAHEGTRTLVYLFYRNAFEERDLGYGSAIIVLLVLVILAVTVIQMKVQKKWVHYN